MLNRSIHCAHYFKSALHDRNRPQVPSQLSLRKCATTLPTPSVDCCMNVYPLSNQAGRGVWKHSCAVTCQRNPIFQHSSGNTHTPHRRLPDTRGPQQQESTSGSESTFHIRKVRNSSSRFRGLTHEFVSTVKTKHGAKYGGIPPMTFLGAT